MWGSRRRLGPNWSSPCTRRNFAAMLIHRILARRRRSRSLVTATPHPALAPVSALGLRCLRRPRREGLERPGPRHRRGEGRLHGVREGLRRSQARHARLREHAHALRECLHHQGVHVVRGRAHGRRREAAHGCAGRHLPARPSISPILWPLARSRSPTCSRIAPAFPRPITSGTTTRRRSPRSCVA